MADQGVKSEVRRALLGGVEFSFRPGMIVTRKMWLHHCGCWGSATYLQEAGQTETLAAQGETCPGCMAHVLQHESGESGDTARQETFEI